MQRDTWYLDQTSKPTGWLIIDGVYRSKSFDHYSTIDTVINMCALQANVSTPNNVQL